MRRRRTCLPHDKRRFSSAKQLVHQSNKRPRTLRPIWVAVLLQVLTRRLVGQSLMRGDAQQRVNLKAHGQRLLHAGSRGGAHTLYAGEMNSAKWEDADGSGFWRTHERRLGRGMHGKTCALEQLARTLSGWNFSDSCRYARLISLSVAPGETPRMSNGSNGRT